MSSIKIRTRIIFLALTSFLLAGCAAIGTSISHHDLDTQTLMSNSIFMNPADSANDKTIFVEVHNTTDKSSFSIKPQLTQALIAKGYRITKQAGQAHYVLQVNLLQMGKNTETAAKEQMGMGYGGALEGAVTGGAIAAAANASVVAGGVGVGTVATVVDNAVQDVTYSGIVDVRITEKTANKPVIYQTRILTTADKVNLRFEEAEPSIEKGLVASISGIFE